MVLTRAIAIGCVVAVGPLLTMQSCRLVVDGGSDWVFPVALIGLFLGGNVVSRRHHGGLVSQFVVGVAYIGTALLALAAIALWTECTWFSNCL